MDTKRIEKGRKTCERWCWRHKCSFHQKIIKITRNKELIIRYVCIPISLTDTTGSPDMRSRSNNCLSTSCLWQSCKNTSICIHPHYAFHYIVILNHHNCNHCFFLLNIITCIISFGKIFVPRIVLPVIHTALHIIKLGTIYSVVGLNHFKSDISMK